MSLDEQRRAVFVAFGRILVYDCVVEFVPDVSETFRLRERDYEVRDLLLVVGSVGYLRKFVEVETVALAEIEIHKSLLLSGPALSTSVNA